MSLVALQKFGIRFPDFRTRSSTAAEDLSDYRAEHIYSALVFAHGAGSTLSAFTVPRSQAIPELKGSGITATTQLYQTIYSELHTNIVQSGQLGSSVGEAAVIAIGISVEQGNYAAGVLNTYGAGQVEMTELLYKTFFQLRIATKPQIIGPTHFFPCLGGAFGTSVANNASFLTNGVPASPKQLDFTPLMISRTDPLEGISGAGAAATLTFSVTTGVGQPVLLWYGLQAFVRADVR